MNIVSNISENEYVEWRKNIVEHIRQQQVRSAFSVNSALLQTYWEIGKAILSAQEKKGWGAQVIDLLSKDLENTFGKGNGFSIRNLKYMRMFAAEYPDFPIVQVPLAQSTEDDKFVQATLAQIPWYHHITLLAKVKGLKERTFYIQQTALNGWSRDVMMLQVNTGLYERQGKAVYPGICEQTQFLHFRS